MALMHPCKDLNYPDGFSLPSWSLTAAQKMQPAPQLTFLRTSRHLCAIPWTYRSANHLTLEHDIVICKVYAQELCNELQTCKTKFHHIVSFQSVVLDCIHTLFSCMWPLGFRVGMPVSEPKQYLINGCYLSSLGLLDSNTPHICYVNINWSQHPLMLGLLKTTLSNSSHHSSVSIPVSFLLQLSKAPGTLCCSPAGGLSGFCDLWFSSEVL